MNKIRYGLVKSNQIIGIEVADIENNKIGKIEDFVLEKFSGKIQYLVLSFSSLLNQKNKFFAVPWGALYYNKEKNRFIINAMKHDLKHSPGFDKDHWPTFNSQEWERICNYYNAKKE